MLPAASYFTLAPDWVCETLTPSTERIDRGKKLATYARAGVAHLWLLNPIAETLEAYRRPDPGSTSERAFRRLDNVNVRTYVARGLGAD